MLFVEFEIDEGFGGDDPGQGADGRADEVQEFLVVLAHHLAEEVETAGRGHDIRDLIQGGDSIGRRGQLPSHPDPDHRLAREADQQGIGDGDDLHDTGIEQALHAGADRGLGEADGLGDRGIGGPAVPLENLDDLFGEVVQTHRSRAVASLHGLTIRRNPQYGGLPTQESASMTDEKHRLRQVFRFLPARHWSDGSAPN